ncbi:MAG: tRNA (adenosine(37)-N6)-dimethylallyltransferase MiaA [Gammaproteobacteria bacterium]|nr:tRNA (adenosine(37)-N6)-dimethylallyltransferase MiaA [Gammaproteobacteria bacterium]
MPPADLPPLHCLMGPTGAGKTAAALWLAARLPIEIVSVDSALVYRGLNIGTAKPDPGELREVPHHLIDICEPQDPYSVARFCRDAKAAVAQIEARGRIPLLVGGTGLYFRRLETGIAEMPVVASAVRASVAAELAACGSVVLHRRLAQADPRSAARIHPNDPQRITRALEILDSSGVPMSSFLLAPAPPDERRALRKWVIAPANRAALRERLAQRFQGMLARGFINEVGALRARPGLGLGLPALRAVGYRTVWAYLDGDLSYAEMVTLAVTASAQYAKRQYTWLRAERTEAWCEGAAPAAVSELCRSLETAARITPS